MSGAEQQCLSVVMPCYNEEPTLEQMAQKVLDSPFTRELIIVDDGSTDRSVEIAVGLADPRVRVIKQPVNLGKGAALRTGFAAATSDYVVVQDADLEYDPADWVELLEPLRDGRADVVYGSRFLAGRPHRVLFFWHSVGNRLLTIASNMFSDVNMTDMETCYKVFRREVLQSIELFEDGFGIEAELTAKVATAGWRIYEVGISYAGRTYAEGKKIGWRDGVWAIFCIVRYSKVGDRLFLSHGRERPRPREAVTPTPLPLVHAPNYVRWLADLATPYVGGRTLVIGPGAEPLAAHLRSRADVAAATDAPPDDADGWDCIVSVNEVSRAVDDVAALEHLRARLRPGGALVVVVPALRALFTEGDARVGHYRRYRRSELALAVGRAGLEVDEVQYVDATAAAAAWLFARTLRRIPEGRFAVRAYDAALVPRLQRWEADRRPRIGQALFCAARRPADAAR